MCRRACAGVVLCALTAFGSSARPAAKSPPEPVLSAHPAGAQAGEEEEEEEREPLPTVGVWDVAAADMDGDSRLDLVTASGGPHSAEGRIAVLFNPGADAPPERWERMTLPARGDYGRVAVGDIDGDGANDVAALTFGSGVLRWWLLSRERQVLEERQISFAGDAPAGDLCRSTAPEGAGSRRSVPGGSPAPPSSASASLRLSSLAFADLDVDGALELVVAGYSGAERGALSLLTFDRAERCFALSPGLPGGGRGSLKVRFVDVDDDGVLDLAASHYALTRPSSGQAAGCAGACLEWGRWWPAVRRAARPLLLRPTQPALAAAVPTPELNVVDFDAVRTGEGVRFALSVSAHLCPAADCWESGGGGFMSVVDASGVELREEAAWKRRAELDPPEPGARLMPRAVIFERGAALAAAYWWGARPRAALCSRIDPCAGPLTLAPPRLERRLLEPRVFAQALALLEAPGAPVARAQSCQPLPRQVLALPAGPVSAVLGVAANGVPLPARAWSWVPGGREVTLAKEYASAPGRACVEYTQSARTLVAVADSSSGLRLVSL